MTTCKPDCRCPLCDSEAAAIMRMSPEQHASFLAMKNERLLNFYKKRDAERGTTLRAAGGEGKRTLRCTSPDEDSLPTVSPEEAEILERQGVGVIVEDDVQPISEQEAIAQLRAAGVLPPAEETEAFIRELEAGGPISDSAAVASVQAQLARTNASRKARAASGGDDRRDGWIQQIQKCGRLTDHFTRDDLRLLSDATLRRLAEISIRHRETVVAASKAAGGGEVREPSLPAYTMAAATAELKTAKIRAGQTTDSDHSTPDPYTPWTNAINKGGK